jgi:hypothetical protein
VTVCCSDGGTVPSLAEADRLFNTVNPDESLNFRLVVSLPSC